MALLSKEFLAPYYLKGDCFDNLLARVTYLSKYCREGESWTDTVLRVVESNCALDADVTKEEAESLFDCFWHMRALPPGRGLWTGGIEGIPAAALYNCWGVVLRSIDDWCWTADMLMLGGGVGVSLLECDKLPEVWQDYNTHTSLEILCNSDHPDVVSVNPDHSSGWPYYVEDSREGWRDALHYVLDCAFQGIGTYVDVSKIRPKGEPIRTFGGIAPGPGPLADLLRSVWKVVRGAAGRKLTTVECLDITNFIGKCVKSGNVRRSALITVGDPTDQEFRDAKKDWAAVASHRHTSNNSLGWETQEQLDTFDWSSLAWDNVRMGEPGGANFVLARKDDPQVVVLNPCGEIFLENREACNLVEVFPARCPSSSDVQEALWLVTRYALRNRLRPVDDPTSDAVRAKNMRLGVALGGICDFGWTNDQLKSWYDLVRDEANLYADDLGVNRPNKVTTVKPSGTISLLANSSPGAHAPFAPYYIRRLRIAKNESIVDKLIFAGVPYEQDVVSDGNWCFEFPIRGPQGASKYVSTETTRDQFERLLALQTYWSDNAVSITVSFDNGDDGNGNYDPSKVAELAVLLKEYAPQVKSLSLLARAHGYKQAPYEEITLAEYQRRVDEIHSPHIITSGGEFDFSDCAGGVCPVRLFVAI